MYGLLGEKLGHSFSPQIHALLGDYEIDCLRSKRMKLNAVFKKTEIGMA